MNPISAFSFVLIILAFYIVLSIFIFVRILRPWLARLQSDHENTT